MNQPESSDKSQVQPLKISRRAATIANLIYQYVTVLMTIINGVLLVPLYLKHIDYSLYGAWLATGNIVVWLTVVDAGLSDVLKQQVAKYFGSVDIKQLGAAITTGFLCVFLLGLIPFLVSFLVAPILPKIFDLAPEFHSSLSMSFVLAGLSSSLVIISGGSVAVQQGLQRNIYISFVYTIGAIVGIVVTIYMLQTGKGLISIPAGLSVRGLIWVLCNGFLMILFCRQLKTPFALSREYFKKIRGLVTWTFINKLSFKLFGNCDAFLVGWLLGVDVAPIVVLTKRAWDLLIMCINRIGVAFMPAMAHLAGEGDQTKYRQVTKQLFNTVFYLTITGITIAVVYNKWFMQNWVGKALYAGRWFDSLMLPAIFTLIMVWFMSKALFAVGDIKAPSIAETAQNTLRFVLLFAGLWLIGPLSVPLSFLISSGLVTLLFFLPRLKSYFLVHSVNLVKKAVRLIAFCMLSVLVCWLATKIMPPVGWTRFAVLASISLVVLQSLACLVDPDYRVMATSFIRIMANKLKLSKRVFA